VTVVISQRYELQKRTCSITDVLAGDLIGILRPKPSLRTTSSVTPDNDDVEGIVVCAGQYHKDMRCRKDDTFTYFEKHSIRLSTDGHIIIADKLSPESVAELSQGNGLQPSREILKRTWKALECICEDQDDDLADGSVTIHLMGDAKDVRKAYKWFAGSNNPECNEEYMDVKFPRVCMCFNHAREGIKPHLVRYGNVIATVPLSFSGEISKARKRA
jgi:hypothetical protein